MKRIFTTALILAFCATAHAGGSEVWELAGYSEFKLGELKNAALSSTGEIAAGLLPEPVDLEATGLVWCVADSPGKRRYLGTGYDGKIYRIEGNRARLVATTGALLVTDMAFDDNGDLYAATLPDPTIWKIPRADAVSADNPVAATVFASVAPALHVWAIAFDGEKKTLFAGTGPDGVVYAIGRDAKAEVFLETGEKHVLALATSDKTLFAGTSPGALLLRADAPGRSVAVADFDDMEVKAILVEKDGTLVAAVNRFATPRTVPAKPAGTAESGAVTTTPTATTTGTGGAVYRIAPGGAAEKLFDETGTHVVNLAGAADGTVYAALGADGRVVSISKDRIIKEELNLEERQVMDLIAFDGLDFVATGDTGAAYAIRRGAPDSHYLTPVLDARTTARWGNALWRGRGQLSISARSGNTLVPDRTWSDFGKPFASGSAPDAPPARYLQLRVSFAKDAAAVLTSATVHYRPENARALITAFHPDTPFKDTKKPAASASTASRRVVAARPAGTNSQSLNLTWTVDNPDNDTLRYRLYYRPEGRTLWLPLFKEDFVLTATKYAWKTDTMPEGRYQLKLTADDSIDNPVGDVRSDEWISVPVEIDNHPPVITGLAFAKGRITGQAKDSFSVIAALDYSIDGATWQPAPFADGIADSPTERFDFAPEPALPDGPHVVTVRAMDRLGNFAVSEIHTTGK